MDMLEHELSKKQSLSTGCQVVCVGSSHEASLRLSCALKTALDIALEKEESEGNLVRARGLGLLRAQALSDARQTKSACCCTRPT